MNQRRDLLIGSDLRFYDVNDLNVELEVVAVFVKRIAICELRVIIKGTRDTL